MTPSREAVRARTLELINNWTSEGHGSGWTLAGRDFDSLDKVELCMALEDEWGVEVPEDLWTIDVSVEQVLIDVTNIVCGREA